MHLFSIHYLLYLLLNLAACFFLLASVLGMPGNPDTTDKGQNIIMDLWGKMLMVTFRGIPALAGAALIAFFFHFENIGEILSWINFAAGLALISLVILYWKRNKR